jgi:class 3 adenylate cyclase
MLNRYFAAAAEPVLNNNGFIDKYIGDGILAVFGTRDESPGTACRNAVYAALGSGTTTRPNVRARVQHALAHRHRKSLRHGDPRPRRPSGKAPDHGDWRRG